MKPGHFEPSDEDLDLRFDYHPANEVTGPLHEFVRTRCKGLAQDLMNTLADVVPSREFSLALTHLETTMMWLNAAIARRIR